MANGFAASAGQQAALPVMDAGSRTQSAQFSIATGSATHVAIDISQCTQLGLTALKFGTLATEYVELQISTDGGTNFRTYKTYATAQLNQANGLYDLVPVKGTHARVFGFNTQVGSGVNFRFFT